MDLWREVDRSSILTGTTLTGRLETLGSIDLDYYLGDNRNRFTDTFHIFDDRFYKNHDVLFSPGTENNNLVGMTREQWNGKENGGEKKKEDKRQSDSGLCNTKGKRKREVMRQEDDEKENRPGD
ncbi:unnamed protein product [Clonostachys rosea f. rosea IK726]|uniref:Uncharacterized protein n=2 Tax=Bionectria ochroleuca TaxID=29856 RepID=A0A0B7KAA9_BIOOC|nr:unnamed protein product [Clonostachys rosea f. rosea IK726]